MKAFRRVVLLTAVLCLYGFISCGKVSIAASGNDAEQDKHVHNIQITGGYVVNCFGEVVTQARKGQDLQIITELQAGTYVSEWIVEGSNVYGDNYFTMPDFDVTVTAVRKKQSPYTLDLRIGATVEGEKSYDNLSFAEFILNAFLPDGSEKDLPYSEFEGYNVDVDGDGSIDFYFEIVFDRGYTEVAAFRKYGGSAHGDYTIERLNNLPYWPITIRFGEEPVKESYSLNVTGGKAYVYDAEWNEQESSSAELAQTVKLSFIWNSDTYLKYWEAEGYPDFRETYERDESQSSHDDILFTMPPKDLEIHAVTGKKTSYTVDLRDGSADVSNEVVLCFSEMLNPEESYHYVYDQDFDLDKNGTTDVVLRDGKFYIASSSCSIRDPYTISGPNAGQYGTITFLFGDYQKEYSISVNGGHAVNENGQRITKAASGTYITIVRDREEGKFFKSWNSDSNLRSNSFSFAFYMPAKNVNIFAETTSSQHELTVDLTEELYHPTEEEEILLGVFFDVFDTMYPKEYRTFSYDLDRDGIFDVSFYDADYEDSDTLRSLRRELFYYSLGTRFSVSVNDGQIGTLTLLVDNSKAEHPVIDNSKSACSITAQGLKIFCYNPDDYDYSSYTDDKTISKAVPGTRLYMVPDYHLIPEGQYIIGFLVEGNGTSKEIYWDSGYDYYMPDYDITISPIKEEQTPLILDFTNGPARVIDGLGFDLAIYYTAGIDFSSAGDNVNAFFYDLNNDGQYEIRYNYLEHLAYFSGEYSRVFAEIIYDNSEKRCEYWPLIFRFSNENAYNLNIELSSYDGQDIGSDIWIYIGEVYASHFFDSSFDKNYAPTIRVLEGSSIRVSEPWVYPAQTFNEFYLRGENGDTVLQYSEEEIQKDFESYGEIRVNMPAENVTVFGKLALKSVLKPSNTPTPTPSPAQTPTDSPSVIGKPADTDNPSSATDSDDFHPFVLLIAGLVLCMVGVGVYAVFYLKKSESNKAD